MSSSHHSTQNSAPISPILKKGMVQLHTGPHRDTFLLKLSFPSVHHTRPKMRPHFIDIYISSTDQGDQCPPKLTTTGQWATCCPWHHRFSIFRLLEWGSLPHSELPGLMQSTAPPQPQQMCPPNRTWCPPPKHCHQIPSLWVPGAVSHRSHSSPTNEFPGLYFSPSSILAPHCPIGPLKGDSHSSSLIQNMTIHAGPKAQTAPSVLEEERREAWIGRGKASSSTQGSF